MNLNKIVRLAYSKPHLRERLVPLIQKYAYANEEMPDWAYDSLSEGEKRTARSFMKAIGARSFNSNTSRWSQEINLYGPGYVLNCQIFFMRTGFELEINYKDNGGVKWRRAAHFHESSRMPAWLKREWESPTRGKTYKPGGNWHLG